MHPVGFEPTNLSIAELKSAPLDHSGTNAFYYITFFLLPLHFLFPFFPFFFSFSFISFYYVCFLFLFFSFKKFFMEMRGIDPLAPRMRNECSTIWATSPIYYFIFMLLTLYVLFLFSKNASGGVRTHASLDSRSWDGPLRPLGHECFLFILLLFLSTAATVGLYSCFYKNYIPVIYFYLFLYIIFFFLLIILTSIKPVHHKIVLDFINFTIK